MNERMYYSKEAEDQAQRERFALALAVMGLGLGIGVVMALLFAPRTGEETRKALAEQVEHVYGDGREATGNALANLRREFERLRADVEERIGQR